MINEGSKVHPRPCPFCGNPAKVSKSDPRPLIWCQGPCEMAIVTTGSYDDWDSCLAAWNGTGPLGVSQ